MKNIKKLILVGLFLSGQIISCSNTLPKALTAANKKSRIVTAPITAVIKGIEASGATIESIQTTDFYIKNAPKVLVPVVMSAGMGAFSVLAQKVLAETNKHLGEWVAPLVESVGVINGCMTIEDFVFDSLGMKDIQDKEKIKYASCSALYAAFVAAIAYNTPQEEVTVENQIE